MKQLVTFKISDGDHEYQSYGIYDHKYSDKKVVKDFFGLEQMQEDYDYKKGTGPGAGTVDDSGTHSKLTMKATF